jgi:hypothetical protein
MASQVSGKYLGEGQMAGCLLFDEDMRVATIPREKHPRCLSRIGRKFMSNEMTLRELIAALHHSHQQYQICRRRFEAQHRQLVIDLGQLAQDAAGNSAACAALIYHSLRLQIPITMLAQALHLDEATLLAMASSSVQATLSPLQFEKISTGVSGAQMLAVQLADVTEQLMLALYDLAGATLHDAALHDAVICLCYEHDIALPMIATAFHESLMSIMQILRGYGFLPSWGEPSV